MTSKNSQKAVKYHLEAIVTEKGNGENKTVKPNSQSRDFGYSTDNGVF